MHEEQAWITLLTCENFNPALTGYTSRRMVRAVLMSAATDSNRRIAQKDVLSDLA